MKAFAREEFQLRRFQRVVKRVFDQSIYSTRLQAFFSPLIGLLPQLGVALVLLVGGVLGAQIGTRYGTKLRGEQLRFLLALLVLAVAAKLAFDLTVRPASLFSITAEPA